MPIKQPKDLSPKQFVAIRKDVLSDGRALEITIRIEERTTGTNALTGKESLHDLKRLGILCGAGSLLDRAGISKVKLAVGNEAWTVLNSDASEAGWGPFLYDIAMELATLANAGIRSHDDTVSEDAIKVWNFYFSKRPDVTKRKLPRKLKPKFKDESLQFMYQKSPDSTVQELKRMGKWKEQIGIVDVGME